MRSTPRRIRATGIGLAATILAATLTAAPAAAIKPVPIDDEQVMVWCSSFSEELSVDLVAYYTLEGTWLEGNGQVATPTSGHWAYEGVGSYGNGAFAATWTFVDGAGNAVGTVTVEGTAEPMGDRQLLDERSRDGNVWNSVTGWVQQLMVSATVTEATGAVAAAADATLGCFGAERDLRFWGTNPATRIQRGTLGAATCDIGEDGWLDIFATGFFTNATLVLGYDDETSTAALIAQGDLSRAGSAITGVLPVAYPPPAEGEEPDSATVNLTIGGVVDRGMAQGRARGVATHQRFTVFELSGMVEAPGFGTLPVTECFYQEVRYVDRFSSQAGQKPGGRPPANDRPDGAVVLAPGAVARTSTRGAAEEPEAACLPDGAWEPLPFTRTLWWSVAGTGQPVTLTTDGSHFNTVIGVYVDDGAGGLAQVACVDNTTSGLLAAVTFDTTAGVVYLVQVGGFLLDFGNLTLRRS